MFLEEIADFLSGYAWSASSFKQSGKLPIIRIQNLGNNENASFVYWDQKYDSRFIVKKGDILLSLSGSIKVDRWNGPKALLNQRIIRITAKKSTNDQWLFWLLKSLLRNIAGMGRWALVNNVSVKELQKIEVAAPSLDEQERIAKTLVHAQALCQKRAQSIHLLDDFLRATFLDMFGDPILNQMKWNMKKFAEVGTLDRGISKNRPRNAPELLGGPYPLIQTGDIANSGGYIRAYNQTYSEIGLRQSKMWPIGTLCITIAANIAKTGILTFEACFPDSVVGFIPNKHVQTEYVQCWLSFLQKILEDKAPESAQKNINLAILRNLDIPLPPIELQDKFSRIVRKAVEVKKIKLSSSVEIDNQFNALMQKCFK